MLNKQRKLLIIDSNSIIHRAFHALPFLTTKDQEKTNALYGFLLVFLKAIKDFQPDYLAACFDLPGLTFRHKKFKQYKAKRPPTPLELVEQVPKVKQVLKAFNVPVFEKKGFEADDLIGTIACSANKVEIIILTGDSDLFQLINEQTKVYFLRKGVKDVVLYGEKQAEEKFQGLSPIQITDLKALKGDPSDNIPGVAGIGEKTAVKLLLDFGSLDNLYIQIENESKKIEKINPRIREILLNNKKQAFFSRELVEINKKVPIDFELEKCSWKSYDKEKVINLLKKFEFNSLINRLINQEKENSFGKEKTKELTLW
jgi:DNA polymerase I